ncbi:MAG: hypothetical protein GQ531_03115 [Sulfurovum sp.]|nr:hypothetical protein [Sulfurovum sp.]
MQEILKRLELIKTAITIEDEEIIGLQIIKLNTFTIDNKVEKIVQLLELSEYTNAVKYIEDYIAQYNGVVIYEDKEISALKLELKMLEQKLQVLSEEQTEYLNEINEFNVMYTLQLGEIIRKILELKEALLQRKVNEKQEAFDEVKNEYEDLKEKVSDLEDELKKLDEFDDAYDVLYEKLQNAKEQLNQKRKEAKQAKDALEEDELFQEYEEAREDYDEFSKEHEEIISLERFELNEEEQKELKKLFRQASRLCHPDIVTDELKEQAHKIMAQLNDAYKQKNLQQIKKILSSLESGIVFDIASDKINNVELLKTKIIDIRQQLSAVTAEVDEIRNDETFKTLQKIDDIDEYFSDLKEQFQNQYKILSDTEQNKEVVL